MPDPASASRGRRRRSSVIRLHLPFLIAVAGCLYAGWFELTRARAGREVAWVYAIEWPLFAILGTYVWWHLLRDTPPRPTLRDDPSAEDRSDPGLVAWQEYLAELHAADPPGGPPGRQVNARRGARHSRGRPPGREG
jgi:hypothetical protein